MRGFVREKWKGVSLYEGTFKSFLLTMRKKTFCGRLLPLKHLKQEVTHFQHELDYVVINDGSTDGTKQILEANQINAIHLVLNLGIGGRYRPAINMP